MFILFLIKPPTATGQSHSSAKIACPAIGTRTDKFAEVQALLEFENRPRRGREASPSLLGGLSWAEIRLQCAASIAARSTAGAAYGCARPPDQQRDGGFTVAAEFINLGSGMCEEVGQLSWAFLNES